MKYLEKDHRGVFVHICELCSVYTFLRLNEYIFMHSWQYYKVCISGVVFYICKVRTISTQKLLLVKRMER